MSMMHLGEYCYNTTYDALTFADMVFGDNMTPRAKDWIQESHNVLRALKDNLHTAQNQQ